MAQEPGPEHELRGLLDQRSLAEDPPVIWLARLVPEHFVAHVGVRRAAGEDVVGILSAQATGAFGGWRGPEGAKIAREGYLSGLQLHYHGAGSSPEAAVEVEVHL